jgi:glycosyltransferase involved in cell wall biosynthesis
MLFRMHFLQKKLFNKNLISFKSFMVKKQNMQNKKLKICHLITRMIIGGAQENTLLSVIGQMEQGHDVTLVTGPSPGPEGELLKKSELLKKYDVKVITIDEMIRPIHPVVDLKAYLKLKKLFKVEKFDVVHTHASKAGIIGRAAAWAAKIPYVVHTVHGPPFHKYAGSFQNFIYKTAERWAAKRCHKIYAVAQAMIDQYIEAKIAEPKKFKVVYSGMELEPFLNSKSDKKFREKLSIPQNASVIGTVARLFPLKGYEFFIPVAAEIVKSYPDVRFLIVGNGILHDMLNKQIAELGLKNNFIFVGLVSPSEVYKYIAEIDILIHLSLREGLPRAVVQSLASGKPVIGYNLDGTPEVIENDVTGYLLEAQEIEGVAAAAIKILSNPEKAKEIGENGKMLVKEKFDWRIMSKELLNDYLKNLE